MIQNAGALARKVEEVQGGGKKELEASRRGDFWRAPSANLVNQTKIEVLPNREKSIVRQRFPQENLNDENVYDEVYVFFEGKKMRTLSVLRLHHFWGPPVSPFHFLKRLTLSQAKEGLS
mmetsp:Transcript_11602/g.20898  ORF Transcript_11602/g.20898 Transcript_11602/m.20898 type:complete len:119 (-) Transcript_11602:124-480(-)